MRLLTDRTCFTRMLHVQDNVTCASTDSPEELSNTSAEVPTIIASWTTRPVHCYRSQPFVISQQQAEA